MVNERVFVEGCKIVNANAAGWVNEFVDGEESGYHADVVDPIS